ncbi:MAG: hypothetical protein ACRELB_26105, partial [Polyangiaceae bacterium]
VSVRLGRSARRVLAPRITDVVAYARRIARQPPPEIAVDPPLAIKIFRDVRLGECGLVLPGAAIRYRWHDLALVALGAAGGVWSRLSQRPIAMLLSPKLAFSVFVLSAFRGIMGMRRSRLTLDKLREEYENRHLQATRMNAVTYFLHEAAETDAKEALLCYAAAALDHLATGPAREPPGPAGLIWTAHPRRLLARVESFLRARFRAEVDFDVGDAIGSLEGFALVPRPGYYAPGDAIPDYFDERLIGESFQEDQELLLSRDSARGAVSNHAHPRTLEDWLRASAERGARDRERRDRGNPPRGCDPLSGAPTWFPDEDEDEGGHLFPREEIALLPLDAAVARLRADMRARLGLDDRGAAEGDAIFGGRFAV